MPGRRSFKTDESFLEKLAIGAIGARAVFADLQRQGHRPIELERGSMDYKIWKSIKIKRLRVPDLLCLDCGTRIEARAKTHLEISMSHSLSDPERGWNKGLNDRDVVALSICAKALSHLHDSAALATLTQRIVDDREHIYVRLEAAAGLARAGTAAGMAFIQQTLQGQYLEHRLEAVIILGEIPTDESRQALTTVLLDQAQHPEIRAGAAWALGELQQPSSVDALVQVFLELAEPIRVEAARALRKIAATIGSSVAAKLPAAQDDQRAGIAWAVSRSGRVKVDELLPLLVDDDARRWVAYILGTQDQQACIGQIEQLRRRDPEVYFAVTVLWKILASWVYDLEEY